jgi:hypothetical protein
MNNRWLAIFCATLTAARAAAPDVVLTGPEVQKLDWNTRVLQSSDINGDGLRDVLVANNDRGTVDILYQLKPGEARDAAGKTTRANRWEPVVEDARFRVERVTTGVGMFDLVSGDLNGDGRIDLAYTGDPQALTVRYQQEDRTWTESRLNDAPAPAQGAVTLRLGDLNGDQRADLVMLGHKELVIFYQTEAGELAPPQRFSLADENCYGLELFDLDGDRRLDIAYLSNTRSDTFRVRYQSAQNQFGPEQAYPIKDASSTLQLLAAADSAAQTPARFVFAQQRTGQLEFFNLEPAKNKKDAEAPTLRPRVFTPRGSGKTPAAYALGDYNSDGREDIAVSDADGAQVFIYFRQADDGFTVAERFPSFSDVRSLAAIDWTGNGRADLVVASLKEQSVGIASVNTEGRLDYPQPLPGVGRPLAVAAGHFTAKRTPTLVVLREEKGKRWFDLVTRSDDGEAVISGAVALDGLKTDPRGLRLFDANRDGLLDVAVFTPLDSLRLFLQTETGAFADATTNTGFRKGLVDNLDAGAVSTGEPAGDGKAAFMVGTGAFARALTVNEDGELTVIDQFNARDTTAEVSVSLVIPPAQGKRAEVVLYDRKGEQFQRLRANQQGVYEVIDSVPVGRIDVVGSEVRGTGAQAEMFLFGKDRFWWLPLGRADRVTRSIESYTTDLPDINYADVIAGDLTGDGRAELVALDPENSVIEILARDEDAKAWVSRMHFKVFESDAHFQGRRSESPEPREAIIADVTGDGKNDLLLLVHDRVLVYPQQ